MGNIKSVGRIAEQLHSPDGEKRGGADAVSLLAPLVMQVVMCQISPISNMNNIYKDIISKFEQLDVFKYSTWEPNSFDRATCAQNVAEALQYHCSNHTYSDLLFKQLIELKGSGSVKICGYNHPYEIREVFLAMERIIENSKLHKPFKKKKSLLYKKNIFHTHHSQNFYSMTNCIRYFKKKYSEDIDILNRIIELKQKYPDRTDYYALFAQEVLSQSLDWQQKTGEWLIYEKLGEQIHFLCLYIHNYGDENDRELYSFIEKHLKNCT